jgi:hypothetical protein
MFGKKMIAAAVTGVLFCGEHCCASPMCCGGNTQCGDDNNSQGMSFADRSYNVVDHGKSFPTTAPAPSCCDLDDMDQGAFITPTNNSTSTSTMDDYKTMMCSPADECCADMMCAPCTPAAADNSTSSFNSTAAADMCCAAPGTCAPPADNFQSAEDMFNNTNTCGDGLSGMMCGIQQNFTSFFGGNSTDDSASSKVADDTLDSCDSDLQDSL